MILGKVSHRGTEEKKRSLVIFVLFISAVFLVPLVFIFIGADKPVETLKTFLTGPWSNAWFLGNTLDSMALLLTASLGALIAFQSGCFNLGGEGQIYLGGCAAAAVLLSGPLIPDPVMLVFAALASIAAGGLMGAASGVLRKQFCANELITSFLLAAALIPLGDYLVATVLRDPQTSLLATQAFSSGRLLPKLLAPSSLSVSIIIALTLVLVFHFLLHWTVFGYRLRIAGASPALALFGGIDPDKRYAPAMAGSGAVAGLAGFFAVAGTHGMCYQGFTGGLGWNAIALAIIAHNKPLLLLPAVFVFGAAQEGAKAAMLQRGFSFEVAAFIQAAVLLLAAYAGSYLKGSKAERGGIND